MKCTSLAMWYWVGCLRSITLLSTQREHLPQSLNSLTALGKCHTNTTSAETCTNNKYSNIKIYIYIQDNLSILAYICQNINYTHYFILTYTHFRVHFVYLYLFSWLQISFSEQYSRNICLLALIL